MRNPAGCNPSSRSPRRSWAGRECRARPGGPRLGAWLKWLRGAQNPILREVRENLAAAIGTEPPAAANQLVVQATQAPTRKSSKVAVLGGLGLVLVLTGLSGWLITRNPAALAVTDIEAPHSSVSEVNERAEELRKLAAQADRERAELLAAQQAALEKQGGVFSIDQGDLLALQKGESARLGGRIEKIESSHSGATLYLYFSREPAANEPRASVLLKSAPDLDRALLEPFIGKEVCLTGKVTLERGRPQITVTSRSAIRAGGWKTPRR
jgi:hypothetical protein